MSKEILLIAPKLASKGGVSAFWNALLLSFRSFNDIHFKIVEIGGHGKNILGVFRDQWSIHQVEKEKISLAILNPSLLNKSFFRDGLFAKQLNAKKIPFIVFFHGWDKDFEKKVDKKHIDFFLTSFAYAQTIFVLSPEFKDKLIEWGYRGQITVETTMIDDTLLENFSFEKNLERKEQSKTIKILFLARLEREKGVFELIEAFEELSKDVKDIELIIAGDGQDFKEVKKLVHNRSNISLTGEVEGEEKIRLFKQSNIYCLPSYSEGLPISVLEAISFGLPVITTEVGGLKYFFQDDKMGKMIKAKDTHQLKEALYRVILDKKSMSKIAKFNFDYGQKYLTNTVMSQRLYPYFKKKIKMKKEFIESYLIQDDLSTHDPYDIWKTDRGSNIKKVYYRHKYIGLLPAGALTIYDLYINNSFRMGYKKQEYPIVRAQAVLTLLNLYKQEERDIYLEYAKKHIDWLLENSSKGYSGYCWGTGFKIVISQTLVYDKNVPFSTNTPYILEAFHHYYQLTKEPKILEVIKSIYNFYQEDILVLEEDENILITSYGPFKDRVVTNAVAYTMFAYSIFYNYCDNKKEITNKIKKMHNFILSVQEENGSWIYAPYDKNSFIDCFHSAFVLKNLIKTAQNTSIEIESKIIEDGYNYILKNFYDKEHHLFKRFSLSNKPSLVKFDLYDNAEMLYLAKLMGDTELIEELEKSIHKFYGKNTIYSVIERFNQKKNPNTLRWAVMPYLLAESML